LDPFFAMVPLPQSSMAPQVIEHLGFINNPKIR